MKRENSVCFVVESVCFRDYLFEEFFERIHLTTRVIQNAGPGLDHLLEVEHPLIVLDLYIAPGLDFSDSAFNAYANDWASSDGDYHKIGLSLIDRLRNCSPNSSTPFLVLDECPYFSDAVLERKATAYCDLRRPRFDNLYEKIDRLLHH